MYIIKFIVKLTPIFLIVALSLGLLLFIFSVLLGMYDFLLSALVYILLLFIPLKFFLLRRENGN